MCSGIDAQVARAVAVDVVDAIESAAYATVVLINPAGDPEVIHSTPEAAALSAAERGIGGPTEAALRSGIVTRMASTSTGTDTAGQATWPDYAATCARHGIHSVAAFPITIADVTVGALTIASRDHHGFGASEIRTGRAAAKSIAELVA